MSNEITDLPVQKNIGLPSNSTNKALYIVVVEDPTIKAKKRVFAAQKVVHNTPTLEVFGYEITDAQTSQLKSFNDASNLAKEGQLEILNVSFPWCRVISITNVSYKLKSAQ